MAPEYMEKLAHINYNAARPLPVHAGSFFDLYKIRRLVGEAKDLVVKAGHEENRKRRFQRRKMACLRLAEAYRVDDVATSVAVMQETSSMEEVATQVLAETALVEKLELREQFDVHYVHFFEEKIPSRQVRENTNLAHLNDIIRTKMLENRHGELAAIYRTRAIVCALMGNDTNAVADLHSALHSLRRTPQPPQIHIERPPSSSSAVSSAASPPAQAAATAAAASRLQSPPPDRSPTVAKGAERQRREDIELGPDDQPTGLELQLLFRRAGSNLNIAYVWLERALPPLPGSGVLLLEEKDLPDATRDADVVPAVTPDDLAHAQQLVKKFAKLARADYMTFLGQLEYSPDVPAPAYRDYTARSHDAETKSLRATRTPNSGVQWPNRIYRVSDLFKEVPVPDLPSWPPVDAGPETGAGAAGAEHRSSPKARKLWEAITFHPLISEVLHSLLLCHCLMQTSRAELVRHAYMASRIINLANPWPLFQAGRNGGDARLDWVDTLRRADGVRLSCPWEVLAPNVPPQPPMTDEFRSRLDGVAGVIGDMARSNAAAEAEAEERRRKAAALEPPSPPPPVDDYLPASYSGTAMRSGAPVLRLRQSAAAEDEGGAEPAAQPPRQDLAISKVANGNGTRDSNGIALSSTNGSASPAASAGDAADKMEAMAASAAANEREFPSRGAITARWMNEVKPVRAKKSGKKKRPGRAGVLAGELQVAVEVDAGDEEDGAAVA